MGSPGSDHWQGSALLKESSDSFPLKDVVICCTSVPDEKRSMLASYAHEMGAVHRCDLTLDVTHLIVGAYDTPKYRYVARERQDVKPMTIQWIEAFRELWINDEEIDAEALEREYALPTLNLLRFSMTGCDDPTQRFEIAKKIKANGATYEGDLTKQFTHLISFRTEGPKYRAAKNWGLHIVSIEWLQDSLERGMILDEKLYDPSLPLEERGKGAWDRTKRTSLGKRSRSDMAATDPGWKRRLRSTASMRLSSQSQSMWGDIVGGESFTQVGRSGVWETNDETTAPKDPIARQQPDQGTNTKTPEATVETVQRLFSGCRFYLDGFDLKKSDVLRSHLVPNGAEVAATHEDLLSPTTNKLSLRLFRVIPSDLPITQHHDLPESQVQVQVITEWWIERCLYHSKFMDPGDHVIGRPFTKYPIAGFSDMTISSATFAGIDLLHVKKAVDLLGGKYSEDMTPKSTVLVIQSTEKLRKDKLDHAQQWGIPIVTASWLWESISAGELLPIEEYLCQSSNRANSLSTGGSKTRSLSLNNVRSKSEATIPASKSDGSTSHSLTKLGESRIDRTAFDATDPTHQPTTVKAKGKVLNSFTEIHDSNSTIAPSTATEPLSEINTNTCASAVSTAPAPTNHPAPAPREEIHDALSNLLAKTKTSVRPADESEGTENRKRGANRILGRATSNVSVASTGYSRASSVDSTATSGRPVQYPYSSASGHTDAGEATNERVRKFANASNDRNRGNTHSPPPTTQVQYDDPEGKEYQEMAMAKMMGEAFDKDGREARISEKPITLGAISNVKVGARQKSRSKRDKAHPGFR